MPAAVRLTRFLLCAFLLSACGTATTEDTPREGERVAEVNGELILTTDVQAWALENEVSRDEALDALISEALLVAEARRRGGRVDRSVTRRAAVQEILSEIEATAALGDVSDEAVRAEYDAASERVAAGDPNIVMPSFEESVDEIRTTLAGRERLAQLQALFQAPSVNEERITRLLVLPVID